MDKKELAQKAWAVSKTTAKAINRKADQISEALVPDAPKEVKGTVAGIMAGAAIGTAIGGIGVAAMGSAVGVSGAALLAVGGGVIGNRWGIGKDKKSTKIQTTR